jgi:hypothetical protein
MFMDEWKNDSLTSGAVGPLLLRVFLAVVMFPHGAQKSCRLVRRLRFRFIDGISLR